MATVPTSPDKRKAPQLAVRLAPWALTAVMAAAWFAGQPRRLPPEPTPRSPPPLVDAALAPPPTPESIDAREPRHGRLARSPWEIPWLGWRDILWRAYREFTGGKLQAVSGSVTFYVLLAIFPAMGAFVSLYGLFADVKTVQDQLLQLAIVLPSDVVSILGDQMMRLATERGANLSAAFLVSVLLSIWSANAGMKSLFMGLNLAFEEREKRNFFYRTALTYAFTFAFLLFISVISSIMVAVPLALRVLGLGGDWLIGARWVILYVVVAAAFTIPYRYGPSRTLSKWRWVPPGALAAAALWMAGSAGFSWYVNNIARVQVTYGSLGAVIAFMLWVHFSVLVVLGGAELSAEIEHQTAQDTTIGPPAPLGRRGAAMADSVGPAFVGVRKRMGELLGVGRRMAGRIRRR